MNKLNCGNLLSAFVMSLLAGGALHPAKAQSPQDQRPSASPTAQPIPVTINTMHMAMAWHDDASDVWVTATAPSSETATRLVIEQCTRVMGPGCKSEWQGPGGMIGVALGPQGNLFWALGGTKEQNQKLIDDFCKPHVMGCVSVDMFTPYSEFRKGKSKTGPNIRLPRDMRTVKKLYGALVGGDNGQFFMAGGLSSYKTAEEAAFAACRTKMGSTGKCYLRTSTGNGHISLFKAPSKESHHLVEQSVERINGGVAKYCGDRKWSCKVENIFDARRPGVVTYKSGS
jgi:hypothetical protein